MGLADLYALHHDGCIRTQYACIRAHPLCCTWAGNCMINHGECIMGINVICRIDAAVGLCFCSLHVAAVNNELTLRWRAPLCLRSCSPTACCWLCSSMAADHRALPSDPLCPPQTITAVCACADGCTLPAVCLCERGGEHHGLHPTHAVWAGPRRCWLAAGGRCLVWSHARLNRCSGSHSHTESWWVICVRNVPNWPVRTSTQGSGMVFSQLSMRASSFPVAVALRVGIKLCMLCRMLCMPKVALERCSRCCSWCES